MLLSVIKYFRGYVHVKLTGYAPERFLNLCGNRNILIWNLKPCENGYTFCISVDAFRQLKPILKKTKTQIRIQKRVGMPFCAFRYRRRYLFPVGLLFFCFLLYDLSGFIWNIEINGNSYLTTETIINREISKKLAKCSPSTLNVASKMIDILLEQQDSLSAE